MKQVLENERQSDYYHTIPDVLPSPGAQTGIPPQQVTATSLPNKPLENDHTFSQNYPTDIEYEKLSREKEVDHPYGELTPVDGGRQEAIPNPYEVHPF